MAALAADVSFYLQPSNGAHPAIELINDVPNILGRSEKNRIKDARISREHFVMTVDEDLNSVYMKHVGLRQSSVNGVVIRPKGVQRLDVNDVIRFLSDSTEHEYTLRTKEVPASNSQNAVVIVNPVIVLASPTKIGVVSPPIIAVAIPIPQIPITITQKGVAAADILHGQLLHSYTNKMCTVANNINATTLLASKTVVEYSRSNALENAACTMKQTVKKRGLSSIVESRNELIVFNMHGNITVQRSSDATNTYKTCIGYTVQSALCVIGPQDLRLNCACDAFRKAHENTDCAISQGRNTISDRRFKNHCKHTIMIVALHFFSESELRLFLA
jgi:FHA domain